MSSSTTALTEVSGVSFKNVHGDTFSRRDSLSVCLSPLASETLSSPKEIASTMYDTR